MGLTLLFVSFSVTADTKVHPAGNSAQSAFLGQVLTHSIHKIHSVPFFRFLELSIISTFIGQTFLHFPHELFLFVTLNPDYREITHRFQKDRDRTNILTERSVIFE